MVGENEGCRGQGCVRSGTCTAEVRNPHNGVEAEEGASCGVRRDLVPCMARRKGSALDRSAAVISGEQADALTMGPALTSGL